ncbi:hypothetical protein L208DRAFT_1416686 [Tricholoma matsutake]|nr:hypothetical protein L208DRAFT_1416686 [Tricholoma matsutake 945]
MSLICRNYDLLTNCAIWRAIHRRGSGISSDPGVQVEASTNPPVLSRNMIACTPCSTPSTQDPAGDDLHQTNTPQPSVLSG